MIKKIRQFKVMKSLFKYNDKLGDDGMEMIQVAILIAIAIILGLIFKSEVVAFLEKTMNNLNSGF
ncbi:MAG: hypothetical protein PUI85_02640 [Eubacteriales bacterium]|nr:hypothetical protein [Eubacteriales bacterium]MDY3332590.1 hypothetical protein [Gallibacter sp.]